MIYYNLSVSGSSGELSELHKKQIAQMGTCKKKKTFAKAHYLRTVASSLSSIEIKIKLCIVNS